MQASGRFLRDNVFLVAAAVLPLAVVGFFLLASAIPRWTVPPPEYDLLVKAGSGASQPLPQMLVDFTVTDGAVQARVRPVPPNSYPYQMTLFLVDHATGRLQEVPVRLPDGLAPTDSPRELPVDALAGRRVLTSPEAPDGYRFDTRSRRGPGLFGDLFGMRRYDVGLVLANRGRVVTLTPPAGHEYLSPVTPLGWVVPEGR